MVQVLRMLNKLVHSILLSTLQVTFYYVVDLVTDQLDAKLIQLDNNFSQIILLMTEIMSSPLFLIILFPYRQALKYSSSNHVAKQIL